MKYLVLLVCLFLFTAEISQAAELSSKDKKCLQNIEDLKDYDEVVETSYYRSSRDIKGLLRAAQRQAKSIVQKILGENKISYSTRYIRSYLLNSNNKLYGIRVDLGMSRMEVYEQYNRATVIFLLTEEPLDKNSDFEAILLETEEHMGDGAEFELCMS